MFELTTKLIALLNALTPADLDRLPPARRQRLAAELGHWAKLAERPVPPASGVLRDLRDGAPRHE